MDTKRLLLYGIKECEAYKEIASYKWANGFRCRSKQCGNDRYFEGKRPYSRRCSKCKADESPTANTVFDRLRMPLNAAVELVKLISSSDKKYKLHELADFLLQRTGEQVETKAIWELVLKIFGRMEQKPVVYDLYAMIITFSGITISMGQTKKQLKYIAVANVTVPEFIKAHTMPETQIAAFDCVSLKTNNRYARTLRINDRPRLNMEWSQVRGRLTDFRKLYSSVNNTRKSKKYVQAYLNYYTFFKNKGTYEGLIRDLTQDRTATKVK